MVLCPKTKVHDTFCKGARYSQTCINVHFNCVNMNKGALFAVLFFSFSISLFICLFFSLSFFQTPAVAAVYLLLVPQGLKLTNRTRCVKTIITCVIWSCAFLSALLMCMSAGGLFCQGAYLDCFGKSKGPLGHSYL